MPGPSGCGEGSRFAQENAVAVNAFTGQSIEALGEVAAFEPDDGPVARDGGECNAGVAEAIFGMLVAVAADEEINRLSHESGLEKGHAPRAVGDVPEMIDRFEFHQRDAAAGLVVHHLDVEVGVGGGGRRELGVGRGEAAEAMMVAVAMIRGSSQVRPAWVRMRLRCN